MICYPLDCPLPTAVSCGGALPALAGALVGVNVARAGLSDVALPAAPTPPIPPGPPLALLALPPPSGAPSPGGLRRSPALRVCLPKLAQLSWVDQSA
jgi:hypothetical protein